MIIRKKYKFEAAHIVRNCASTRCSRNIHGHSFIVEVFLHSQFLDEGDMVIDFGLLKETIGELIDWFDHSLMVWIEDENTLALAHTCNERSVYLPYNSTAENLSKLLFMCSDRIISHTLFQNGEIGVSVKAVRVHETATGYAECSYGDIGKSDWKKLPKLHFSHVEKDHTLLRVINDKERWENPKEI